MKTKILISTFVLFCFATFAATIQHQNDLIRLRQGTLLTIDGGSQILDEDAGWTLSNSELGYIDGVTSAIQTQLDAKPAASGGTLTNCTFKGGIITNGTTLYAPTISGSVTTNVLCFDGAVTNTLHFTNGILMGFTPGS